MLPLNYAVLKHFMQVDHASAAQVMDALKGQYGDYRTLNEKYVLESLMSAEQNDLLQQDGFDLDDAGKLNVYYKVTDYGAGMIRRFIK